ncbi:MAG: response regulator [Deltaproteobacteria bacterium]|nr:response regulator [Nannocystaceae bacterium]
MSRATDDERVCVWAPRGRDGSLAVTILRGAGLSAERIADVDALCAAIEDGVGCLLVTEETLTPAVVARLAPILASQPPWSDLPLLVFADRSVVRRPSAEGLDVLGNVAYLERPVQIRTLLASVHAALRGRRRQYEAREAIARRDEFLAMLGHELRNPLAAILLASDLLGEGPGEHQHTRERGIILRQARHLSRLVDDLLDVSRVTSGKVALRCEDVDLGRLAQRCVQQHECAAAEKQLALALSTAGGPLRVHGDPLRLEQVLNNLIINAMKYTPAGGHVEVEVDREGSDVVMRVRDDGIGIDAPLLTSIFDLFTQAPATIDRSEGGLGLGLTMVRTLVQLHAGSVTAHSDGRGHGTRLEVRLPAKTEPSAPAARTELCATQRSMSVVLVDDNLDLAELLVGVLEGAGHRVESASDGPSGLARILAVKPDVAIVDIGLPGLDGYSVARKVREQLGRDIRLVAITGYGQPEDRESTREAGFDEHLVKPASPAQVLASLAAAREHSHQHGMLG